jgi:hypothetical protein
MVGFFCAVAGSRLRKLWRNERADGEACRYSQKHNGGGGKFVESAEGSRLKIQEAYWGGRRTNFCWVGRVLSGFPRGHPTESLIRLAR